MDLEIICLNIIVILVYSIFSIEFGNLILVSRNKYLKYPFIIAFELINLVFIYYQLPDDFVLLLILLYYLVAYHGHILKSCLLVQWQ